MYVDVDFSKIKKIETSGPDEGVYTISVIFINDQCMTYGYIDKDQYAADYIELITSSGRIENDKELLK